MTAGELIALTVQEDCQGEAHVVVVNGKRMGETRELKPEDVLPDPDLDEDMEVYIRIDGVR